jgi:cation-transporting P-type ATPase E
VRTPARREQLTDVGDQAESTSDLDADPDVGLTAAEVEERLQDGRYNAAPPKTGRTYSRIFFDNLFTLVHMILLTIAGVLIMLGFFGDAVVTAGLVVANVTVGVFQEARAKRKLDRVALLLRPEARVIRDGREQIVAPEEIVQDDVLIAESGDQFLVDGEVVQGGPVSVDESLLTGESDLVSKRPGDSVYSGSYCMTGSVRYLATKVGQESVVNEMTIGARSYRNVRTPLQREVALIIQVMLVMAAGLALQIVNQYRGGDLDLPFGDSVRAAAVIFGLVPQGLVFMVTVTYAMAAVRLAGRGLLIQRMNAVESTSHVDVLCVDKTGTLTTNRLFVDQLLPNEISEDELRSRLGVLVASVSNRNRTAEALLDACPSKPRELRLEIPFSSEWKWSGATFVGDDDPRTVVFGAPEVFDALIATPPGLEEHARDLTEQGLRVLLVAASDMPLSEYPEGSLPELPTSLRVLGLVSIRDELRHDARETIDHFRQAGIQPKVISGDHPGTVAVLARQAGLDGASEPVSGYDIDELNDYELEQVALETNVFGRITPRQKERLVDALNRQGHYVAMIGDGVNDVLALKKSHVAMAMRSGSQVTRSVADLVLMDDSFSALPRAFQEGQRILRGMEAIIRLFLTRGFYMGLIIIGVSLLGYPFPSTPKLDTLLALLTIGIPILALAFWATPGDTPQRILRSASHFVVPAAFVTAALGISIYIVALEITEDLFVARTVLVTASVLAGIMLVAFVNPPHRWFAIVEPSTGDWRPAAVAAAMVLGYVLILLIPPIREFYELEILSPAAYAAIAGALVIWLIVLRGVWRLQLIARAAAFWRNRFAHRR